MSTLSPTALLSALLLSLAPALHAQEATGRWEDIATFTAFNPKNISLEKIAKEGAIGKTLSSPGSTYGISVETLALGRLSPEDLVNLYLKETRTLRNLTLNPTLADFDSLQLSTADPADAKLIKDTFPGGDSVLRNLNHWQIAPFKKAALTKLEPGAAASRAWASTLLYGATPFQQGGLLAIPSLEEPRIQPGKELQAIFDTRPAVTARFTPTIQYALTGKFPENTSNLQINRWRRDQRDGRTRLSLATLVFQPRGQGLKFSEIEWMGSSDEFARVTLTELWPVTYAGKPASLIWRGDYILTSLVAGRSGAQRLAVEMYHLQHIRAEMKAQLAHFAGL